MKVDPNAPANSMSIRLAIAAQIMAQLVVEPEALGAEKAAEWSLKYADALIAAHNEDSK